MLWIPSFLRADMRPRQHQGRNSHPEQRASGLTPQTLTKPQKRFLNQGKADDSGFTMIKQWSPRPYQNSRHLARRARTETAAPPPTLAGPHIRFCLSRVNLLQVGKSLLACFSFLLISPLGEVTPVPNPSAGSHSHFSNFL